VSTLKHCLLSLCALVSSNVFAAPAIERIEPPNWWVGMHQARVQLMVHGANIALSTPSLDYPGVVLVGTTRSSNPNYLFLDLDIGTTALPGALSLRFTEDGQSTSREFSLLARAPNSAERVGFTGKDVILNLMPDRFANGDVSNDRLPGMAENAARNNPNGRHGGDIAGIEQHLDYIAEMGYTMIWPTPLIENAQANYSYHGYAATDLYRIDPRFGSNASYRAMVEKAGGMGVGVIFDVIPNHIGDGHWWMKDMPSKDWLNYPDRYVGTKHARTALFDPYGARIDRENFTRGWFVPSMPDLNQSNPLLATYLIQNTLWWIEYAGLSGLRVDTFGYSDTAFLADWTRRVRQEFPRLSMVGEEWSGTPYIVSRWLKSSVDAAGHDAAMPNMMDFPLAETLRSALVEQGSSDGGLNRLYTMLSNDVMYPDAAKLVLFEGNHDLPRLYSVLDDDLDLYRMALVFIATARRIPQFYYGTEVLMPSPKNRDDAAARRDFPGGWASDSVNAFSRAGLTSRQREAQSFVRQLLNWRKTATAVHDGTLLHFHPENDVYVYFRQNAAQHLMIVLNKNPKPQTLDLGRFAQGLGSATRAKNVLTGAELALEGLTVPARSATIFELAPTP
jgi:neopullulanase